jgi:polyisoprenoid-binding protein YceI
MTIARAYMPLMIAAMVGAVALGCEDKPATDLAPTASALAPAKPASATAAKFEVDAAETKVSFLMDAPLEKIHGKAPGSMSGELFVDLGDITKSSGLVKVDLFKLELFQQKRPKEGEEFGEEVKSDKQNEHAKAWLEIDAEAPEAKRQEYRYIEFKVTKIEAKGEKSISALKGDERKLTVTVTGEFRLHGRKTIKTTDMEVTVKYAGDKPVSAHFKSLTPLAVGLDEHDVRPREAFGKLAQKTLEAMAPKVAKEAAVSLEFEAKAK